MTLKVAIIGAGQQGASIARALNDEDYTVSIYDSSQNALHTFAQQAQTDHITICSSSDEVVSGADIVVLATPIDRFPSTIQNIADALKPGAIITDIGSGKEKAITHILNVLPDGISYVPAHPINGKAKPGPENSDPEMYKDQTIVVVPDVADVMPQAIIENLWIDMGGKIAYMDAQTHDNLYGTISHFEHVIAFALTKIGEDAHVAGTASEDYKHAGRSALATTRISAGSADMWIPVFRDNKQAVLTAAEGFRNNLMQLASVLKSETSVDIQKQLQSAHDYRVNIKDERRESLVGEVDDLKVSGNFNDQALARRITLPALIGGALTLNAMDVDQKLFGVSIKNVANPSFKDGSAPMLTDPAYVADLLHENRTALLNEVQNFLEKFDELVGHIENEDTGKIRTYIESVNSIRAGMPPKAAQNTVRPQYEIQTLG